MKRTGQSCLSNFAAVQTCCVVTVRLLQTRYFQYCPFVLPVCQAGTLPESRKTSTKMSEYKTSTKLSSMKTLLYTDLTGKNIALFRIENSRLLHCSRVLFHTYCFRPYFPENVQIPGTPYLITNSSPKETNRRI